MEMTLKKTNKMKGNNNQEQVKKKPNLPKWEYKYWKLKTNLPSEFVVRGKRMNCNTLLLFRIGTTRSTLGGSFDLFWILLQQENQQQS